MNASSGWEGGRIGSALLGAICLVSLAYYVPTQANNTTFDPGLIERFIVAPILIWGLGVAVHLTRLRPLPRFAATAKT